MTRGLMFAPWLANAGFACLASVQLAYWVAWGGSLVLSIALVVLMWTRWGQSRPLQKCAALSLLVHLMLAFLTMTVRIVVGDGGGGGGGGVPIRVRIVQEHGPVTKLTNFATESNLLKDVAAPPLLALTSALDETASVVGTPPRSSKSEAANKKLLLESESKVAEKHDTLMPPAL